MNIRDLFKQLNIEFKEHGEHHHCTEGRINIDCPHCSPNQKAFRLGWHLKDKYFSCWNCGPQQTINTFIALTGSPFNYIKDLVKGILPEDFFEKKRISTRVQIPESVGPLHQAHIDYLRGRGFKNIDELIHLWKIQGIDHLGDRLAWRIYIPILFDNEVVSWTTRSIGDKKDRYLSASANESKLNLKQLLYGEDYVNGKTIIVFEGPINVWKVGPGSTAILGLEYTNFQVRQIAKYPIRYVCMDATEQAQEVAERLCADLDMFDGETHNVELETAKDAAAAKPKEVKKLQELLL